MPTLLDCTLRDGGYYTNWEFDRGLIHSYLNAMSAIQVDFVEIGFRGMKSMGFLGPHATCSDGYLRTLNIPSGLNIGVMVNASDFADHSISIKQQVAKIFRHETSSPVSLVRIAFHFKELKTAIELARVFMLMGYKVGLNLMQIASRTSEEIALVVREANALSPLAFYFADSNGALEPAEIETLCQTIRSQLDGVIELGVHLHNNLGLANLNTLTAVRFGASFADATVTGMGRGPGNAQTEILCQENTVIGRKAPNIAPILDLVEEYFAQMKAHFGWGTNAFYHFSGRNNIHPTYVQSMLADDRFDNKTKWKALLTIKKSGSQILGFDKRVYETLLDETAADSLEGEEVSVERLTPNAFADFVGDKKILILGQGPSLEKYQHELTELCKFPKLFVISLNKPRKIDPLLVDLVVNLAPERLVTEISEYNDFRGLVLSPFLAKVNIEEQLELPPNFYTVDVKVEKNTLSFLSNCVAVPKKISLALAIAILSNHKGLDVFLAGIDGFDKGDPRNKEIAELLVLGEEQGLNFASLTPSAFSLPVSNLFEIIDNDQL